MQKAAPSVARILTMVVFALSCFGLLLFLWLSFGGPVPLKPQGYRFQVAFPEATTLAEQAEVRIAGVPVGKVREKQLDERKNRTLAVVELDPQYAPLSADAKAMLRQKTLLGETYVELTPGTSERKIKDGGRLADGRVGDAVQLDEIFEAFDPLTRESFKTWQQDLAEGVRGRGGDINAALATLPGFARDGTDLLEVLNAQEGAVQRLFRNTGVVFSALSENETQLRNLVTSSARVFEATASQQDALAETFRVFPTFLDESRTTLARLKTFAGDTRPLIRDLRPVARDLQPTLRDVRGLAPSLKQLFADLDPLIRESKTGMPATREILRGAKPLLAELGPFLGQLNPLLRYFEFSQGQVSDFIVQGGAALSDETKPTGPGVGHYLRQFGVTGSESIAMYQERQPSNRGNTYLGPLDLAGLSPEERYLIFPNFDCRNTESGGTQFPDEDTLGCYQKANPTFQGKLQGRFPHVEGEDYGSR